MPRDARRPPKRAVLWGVIIWVPFLAIPFSVFFMEVRWQHEVFANDFEIHRLGKELRDSERRIAEYEEQETHLKTMDALDAMAMELQLVAPGPGQIETVLGEAAPFAARPDAVAVETPPPPAGSQPLAAAKELAKP